MGGYPKNRRGIRYGRLTAVEIAGRNNFGQILWRCSCECGGEKIVRASCLVTKNVTTCGRCVIDTHGKSNDRIYNTWRNMIGRCRQSYWGRKHYFDRGITVCDKWKKFRAFYEDMGEPPSKEFTLDRIDNNLGYAPGNCRWVTQSTQNCNRRRFGNGHLKPNEYHKLYRNYVINLFFDKISVILHQALK